MKIKKSLGTLLLFALCLDAGAEQIFSLCGPRGHR